MWGQIALWAMVFWAGVVAGNMDSAIRQGESMREVWEMQESVLAESCRTWLVRSSFSDVPYFRDDTGKLLQEEDGYLYSYWGGVLARYDVDTLEREVLYEAASEQNGRLFCMDGAYIYFLEIPDISPYGKKSILYRVKKDGTGLTVLDENVPDAGMYDGGGSYQEYTAMDIEKDVLYLMHDEIVVCYRIKPEGGVEQIDMADTLYGMVPEGFRTPNTSGHYFSYWNLPSIPYCAGNFGYFFACSEEYGWLIRVDAKSGIVENMTAGLPERLRYYDHLQLTHDSLFYSLDQKIWMRRGLESESEWETWYESDQELRFCSYDESGMYFEAWMEGETEEQSGVWLLYRINWEGERTCLFSMEGEQFFSEYPMGFPLKRFLVIGDYLYYFEVTEQGEGIYRLPLAEAEREADVRPQLVCIYNENKTNEIGYIESVKTGPKGDVIALPTQFDKLYLYERTDADKKINAFLKELYREHEAVLAEENEAFCRDFEEEWEWLQELWEGWHSKDNPDMEEQEQKRVIAEESTEEISVSISYVSEAYLVVDIAEYGYRYPGAHGMYWDDYYVFDRRTGERLTLLDFVDNTEEEVEELVSTYLELCGLPSDAEGIAQETERFFLTAEGIGIHYDVYELSSYASGAQDIIIPYAEFRISEGMIP
ncbi:MAG: DUF3298 domain-containing protein [Lachnospiraceae bacterium]|nr:DUF3298 domain-containing protein [Lachnospiraceae bacterium]